MSSFFNELKSLTDINDIVEIGKVISNSKCGQILKDIKDVYNIVNKRPIPANVSKYVNTLYIPGRSFVNQALVRFKASAGGTLPTGISANTNYYLVKVPNEPDFYWVSNIKGSNISIDISSIGSGNLIVMPWYEINTYNNNLYDKYFWSASAPNNNFTSGDTITVVGSPIAPGYVNSGDYDFLDVKQNIVVYLGYTSPTYYTGTLDASTNNFVKDPTDTTTFSAMIPIYFRTSTADFIAKKIYFTFYAFNGSTIWLSKEPVASPPIDITAGGTIQYAYPVKFQYRGGTDGDDIGYLYKKNEEYIAYPCISTPEINVGDTYLRAGTKIIFKPEENKTLPSGLSPTLQYAVVEYKNPYIRVTDATAYIKIQELSKISYSLSLVKTSGVVISESPLKISDGTDEVTITNNTSYKPTLGQTIIAKGTFSNKILTMNYCSVQKRIYQKILNIGDSLTYSGATAGFTGGRGMNASSTTTDYVYLLKNRMFQQHPLNGRVYFSSYLAAQAGGRLSDVISKLGDFNAFQPDLITLQIGENEHLGTDSFIELYERQYKQVLDSLQQNNPNARIFCFGVWSPNGNYTNDEVYLKETVMAKICSDKNIPFRSMKTVAIDTNNSNPAGGAVQWHPNDNGHLGIANLFWDSIGQEIIGLEV